MDEPVTLDASSETPAEQPTPHYHGFRKAEPAPPLTKYSKYATEPGTYGIRRKKPRKETTAMQKVLAEKFPKPPEPAPEPTPVVAEVVEVTPVETVEIKTKGRPRKKTIKVNLPDPPPSSEAFDEEGGQAPTSTRRAPKQWSECDEDYDFVFRLAAAGLTLVQLAKVFGVHTSTVKRWKQDPRYAKNLKDGKDVADEAVVRSLWERANGYSWDDTAITSYQGSVEKTPIVKHVAPDVLACIFWLKNRRPNEWKDRKEVSSELKKTIIHDIRKLTNAELAEFAVNPEGVIVGASSGSPDSSTSGT